MAGAGRRHVPSVHADVRTLNEGYKRTKSSVLVREISRPTRANLDYAAYHANFMNADPEPEGAPVEKTSPDTSQPFGGIIEKSSLTGDISRTALTEAERKHPLAFAPVVEYLAAKKVAGADALEDVGGAVRGETWGLPGGPQIVRRSRPSSSSTRPHRPSSGSRSSFSPGSRRRPFATRPIRTATASPRSTGAWRPRT